MVDDWQVHGYLILNGWLMDGYNKLHIHRKWLLLDYVQNWWQELRNIYRMHQT